MRFLKPLFTQTRTLQIKDYCFKLKEPVVEYLNCSNEIFILLVEHHLETFACKVSFESEVNSMTFGRVSLHRVAHLFSPRITSVQYCGVLNGLCSTDAIRPAVLMLSPCSTDAILHSTEQPPQY